jgi:CRP/FNR family transcriptional regulator
MAVPQFIENIMKVCNFSNDERKLLIDNLHYIEYKKGESMLKQGVLALQLFFIHSGLVKLVLEGYKERSLILDIVSENEILGLPSLFSENKTVYSAIALNNVETSYIETNIVYKILETNRLFLKFCYTQQQFQNQFLYEKINIVGNKQIHGRFAGSLLYLNSDRFKDKNIFQIISRKELSELSAISLDSTMKLINEFKSDKIIDVNGKEIEINDREMMERLFKIG